MSGDQNPTNVELAILEKKGYVLGPKIGQGSYATVYLSVFQETKTKNKVCLACKMFDASRAFHARSDTLPSEVDIMMKVDHPNIVMLHSILRRGDKIFMFMDFAENGDLLAYINKQGPIPEAQSKSWFKQLLSALRYLHKNDIAHRDLKCENILISKRMSVKLSDFGFARYCTGMDGRRELSRTYCGSTAYVAPEIVSNVPYNPKLADVWSLGVVLFIMLNASMPFVSNATSQDLLKLQVMKQFSFQNDIRISPKVRSLIRMILEPDLTRRLRLSEIPKHPWLTNTEYCSEYSSPPKSKKQMQVK